MAENRYHGFNSVCRNGVVFLIGKNATRKRLRQQRSMH
jgi:hypothetical protein